MLRRNFFPSIVALFGTSSAAISNLPIEADMSDVTRFVWLIDYYGAELVATHLLKLCNSSTFTMLELKRSLNRDRQKERRHAKSASRRESHAGNEILYYGPLQIHQSFDCRLCVSNNRKKVLVGQTDQEYSISGIGVGVTTSIDRNDDGLSSASITAQQTRCVVIPAKSRVLIDTRHGDNHTVWACEVVRTKDGRHRIHLWQTRNGLALDKNTDSIPCLKGGIAYNSAEQRVTGLLGLPLEQA